MKKNVIKIVTALLTLSMLTACGSKTASEVNTLNEKITTLNSKITELETENTSLKADITALTEERDSLKAQLEKADVETPVEPAADEETLPVYGADNNHQRIKVSSVTVKTDEPLLNKMNFLGAEIGVKFFGGLTMEAKEIKTVSGKKVLVMNLIEGSGAVGEKSWVYDYFQGSTGGLMTSIALSETFLQKEYSGTWIDGVQFLLDGEKIDFEHVEGLSEIIYK
ncbi:MAG: hypothetical protein WBI17_04120 [Clostridiaceae bacterium]